MGVGDAGILVVVNFPAKIPWLLLTCFKDELPLEFLMETPFYVFYGFLLFGSRDHVFEEFKIPTPPSSKSRSACMEGNNFHY